LFEEELKEFEPIFSPKSIAVVGVSAHEKKSGSQWIRGLLTAGFPGVVYPIGSNGGTIEGLNIFPSLKQVPGEVDYVVICIPRDSVLELLDDCAAKKVKFVQFFTAGFSELSEEGRELEEQIVRKARQGGFRVIGPNCIGVYCSEGRLPCGPSGTGAIGPNGPVSFVSHSGSILGKVLESGMARHVNCGKAVNFGNGIDLDASDFLQYLAADSKTSVIGVYLEGTRAGRRLFDTMKEVAKSKPLVVWKGGRTEVGAQAAMSHTGSLASSTAIWSAMLKQVGAIEATNLEELCDILLIFQQLGCWRGENVAVIGGLADGGGGISVSASDACAENGLRLPSFSSETRMKLTQLLGEIGNILCNPIDAGQAIRYGLPNLFQAIEAILEDPAIELLLIQEDADILITFLSREGLIEINEFFIQLRNKQNKPVVIVLPPDCTEAKPLNIEQKLAKASVPVFPTMERAAKAIVAINKYCSIVASQAWQS